uniref:Uncharacterized protein n=1 Tax=Panagrolaimus davidi TaxID=227884 RepID=A0A914PKI0_9BILA
MLAPRFRFFPFHYYFSQDKSQQESQRVRRTNKLANMMRLGKRGGNMITREQSATNSVTPWNYANIGTIPLPKPSYITGSAIH